jgi:hypothetical protein
MKKILLVGFIALGVAVSCKKEAIAPKTCNCGLVESDNVQDYSVVIKNSCSGNNKKFYLQEGDWMNAYVGSNYCITNVTSW